MSAIQVKTWNAQKWHNFEYITKTTTKIGVCEKNTEKNDLLLCMWMRMKTVGVLLRFCFRSIRLFELAGIEKMRWTIDWL